MSSPQSVTRVLRILEMLSTDIRPVSLADISRLLKAPKSSVASLLRGLTEAGFAVSADGGYRLGPAAFGLGSSLLEARRHMQSSEMLRDGMQRLATLTGETVLFAVADPAGDSMTYIEVIESQSAIRFSVRPGDRRPLYCTAGGRILLADLPDKVLSAYFRRLKPQAITASTVTDKRVLQNIIDKVRSTGIAQTMDQADSGVTGTAAAIRDGEGQLLGALVVAAPSQRIPDQGLKLAHWVLEEARSISRNLGYRP